MKKEYLSGAGYTTVFMVVNMNQFIKPEDKKRFETIRGTKTFASAIKNEWESMLKGNGAPFHREEQFVRQTNKPSAQENRMDVDDVAFNTGIFKGIVLREFSAPFFKVDKGAFEFDPLLSRNYQFKNLFLDNWKKWDIHIRPTMTGMFVIRLTNYHDHLYGTQSAEFRTISTNVQNLQASFDIPSALEQRDELLSEINKGTDTQESEENLDSVYSFLEWLGVDGDEITPAIDYPRFQWQLAQEVCVRFTQSIGPRIHLPNLKPIHWCKPERNITSSLNDSYTVYHFNEIHAPGRMIERPRWDQEKFKESWQRSYTINYRHLESSPKIQEGIAQLIEGSMLKQYGKKETPNNRRFPPQSKEKVDRIFKANFSTWADELCLLTPRCAVIWPSRSARSEYLAISSLPTATSRVKYLWYWDAMERMVEFVMEIKLLASLVELESVEALNRFSYALNKMRIDLLDEGVDLDREQLAFLAEDATNLSRLVGLSRRLSTAQTWSRAEHAAKKATEFISLLNIPLLITHAETNVDNMTNLINHQDELYLAKLSERSNKSNQQLTLTLFLASLALLVFTLPSFWTDSVSLYQSQLSLIDWKPGLNPTTVPYITYWFGNIAALVVVGGFGWIAIRTLIRWVRRRIKGVQKL